MLSRFSKVNRHNRAAACMNLVSFSGTVLDVGVVLFTTSHTHPVSKS